MQSDCPGLYADIDSVIVHVKKNHKDVRVTDDFVGINPNNNVDPLDNHLRDRQNNEPDVNVDHVEAMPIEFQSYKEKMMSLLLIF